MRTYREAWQQWHQELLDAWQHQSSRAPSPLEPSLDRADELTTEAFGHLARLVAAEQLGPVHPSWLVGAS